VDSKNPFNNVSIIKNPKNIQYKNKKETHRRRSGAIQIREMGQIPAKIRVVHWRFVADPDALAAFFFSGV
jgi:hypothetical protein